jgi:hypothetical protein
MNFGTKILLVILSGLMLIHFSCYRDVIDLDLQDIGSRVVIEGNITDWSGPYTVKISKPVDFEQAGKFQPISDAEVIITDNTGNSEILQEGIDGYYRTRNLQGIPGKTYSLNVSIDGEQYTAISKMPEAIELDSIKINSSPGPGDDIICYFTDLVGAENYCRLKVFRNGELIYTFLYQDRYSDGQQIVVDDIYDIDSGDHVEIQFLTIDKEIFEYFETLSEISETSSASTTLLTPYNPKSNISNNALGYFSAHTLRRYSLVVQ